MIHDIFAEVINEFIPGDECGIFLSGGIDSIGLAFAANRIGKKLTAYTFTIGGKESYDYLKAKEICDVFGWDFVSTDVPVENLEEDFKRLIFEFGCKKKTFVECMYPFLYVYPNIRNKDVICGVGDLYGTTKKVILNYKEPKSVFDNYRTTNWAKKTGTLQHKPLSDKYGINIVYPLYDQRVCDYFVQFSWEELNRPVQKRHVREEYSEELSKIGKVKPGINLQIGSDIDHLFETLLNNPRINYNGRSRVMDLVRDWANQSPPESTLESFFS